MKRARPDDPDDEPRAAPALRVAAPQTLPWLWLPPEMHVRVRMQLVPTAALALALTCTWEYSMPKGQWGYIARGVLSLRGAICQEPSPSLYRVLGYTFDANGKMSGDPTASDKAWVMAHWREPGQDIGWMVARRGIRGFVNILRDVTLSAEEYAQWRQVRRLAWCFCQQCGKLQFRYFPSAPGQTCIGH